MNFNANNNVTSIISGKRLEGKKTQQDNAKRPEQKLQRHHSFNPLFAISLQQPLYGGSYQSNHCRLLDVGDLDTVTEKNVGEQGAREYASAGDDHTHATIHHDLTSSRTLIPDSYRN
ncbi:hypothetical protein [Accumulibacter sp.]|uniref:hypothetical protein n=1 Tax=Accumulibacter sp. TaxID=2053492 RepID=UPI0028C451B0|nr:hypothetical protein [Accumulibacter sp.]